MADTGIQLLSQRAQVCSKATKKDNLNWVISADLYDRESNPNGYVNVGIAENTLMHEELRQHVFKHTNLPTIAFTYGNGPFGTRILRETLATFLNKHLKPRTPLSYSQLIVTNGVSHSIEHCAWALANEGDGILLGRPYYRAFLRDLSLRPASKVVEVAFGDVDPMSTEAVQSYEKAILNAQQNGMRIAALMLCHPHNPLGRCYSKDVLVAYLKLCQKYQVHLISDEIYALSIFNNKNDSNPPPIPFISILSFDISEYIDPALVHVLWGMSKDFGANGLRLGTVISQHNAPFLDALITVSIFSSPSSISEHVVSNLLNDNTWIDIYIETNQKRLSDAYSHVVAFLNEHKIEYVPGANAAFFLWMDLGKAYLQRHPDRNDTQDINQEVFDVLLKHKVFIANGVSFGAETKGMFRLTFSHRREYIDIGLQRMIKALDAGLSIDRQD